MSTEQKQFYRPKGSPRSSVSGSTAISLYKNYGKLRRVRPVKSSGEKLRAVIEKARQAAK